MSDRTATGERCPGGAVTVAQKKRPSASSRGWWRADCPSCGKDVAFHWITGNFRAHNRAAHCTEADRDDSHESASTGEAS